MDPLIHSDRVLTDMIVLKLKRNSLCMHACLLKDSSVLANCLHLCMSTIASLPICKLHARATYLKTLREVCSKVYSHRGVGATQKVGGGGGAGERASIKIGVGDVPLENLELL